jgi:hypothetical protein
MPFLAKQFHRVSHLGFSPCVIRMIGITVDVTLWEQAPLVIGADGIHSVVRSKLFGSIPPRDNGRTMWRALIDEDLCSDLVPPISHFRIFAVTSILLSLNQNVQFSGWIPSGLFPCSCLCSYSSKFQSYGRLNLQLPVCFVSLSFFDFPAGWGSDG